MKPIKIVIFGPNNSGKTTLAETITKAFPEIKSLHSPGPVPLESQIKFIEDNLNSDESVVFDRFPWIEEETCGRVIRHKSNFETVNRKDIYKWIKAVDLFVYCFPGMDNILAWGEREQMNGVKENIWKLAKSYSYVFDMLQNLKGTLSVIHYDYTGEENLSKLMEMIESEYNSRS